MKIIGLLVLMTAFSAHAALEFECRDGDEVETLVVETNQAKIRELTLINMMEVAWNLPIRSYAIIGSPWYDLELDIRMMKGEEGYARLSAHDTYYGTVVLSKFYQCTPK